jgi:glucose/arabinose dehydrogenase
MTVRIVCCLGALAVAFASPARAQPALPDAPRNTGPASTPRSAKATATKTPPSFVVAQVAKFNNPAALAFLPDGSMLVTEKAGAVRRVTQAGEVSAPLTGVPRVARVAQGGLLDIKPAPDFARNGLVYLTYSEPADSNAAESSLALARGKLVGNGFENMTVLWREGPKGKGGQFGSTIAFAPDGRSLFLSTGDRMRKTPSQEPESALGKILHLTLDGKPDRRNPMFKAGGTRALTWATGLRNPYGLAFAPDGRLWSAEFGPYGGDELNLIEAAKNFGWPVVSNGDDYNADPIPDHPTHPEFEPPRLWWNPSLAPSSLIFYSGKLFKEWQGSALLGGLSGMAISRVAIDAAGQAREVERFDMKMRVRDIVEGPDGAIWALEDGGGSAGGRLFRLTPKG